MRSILVLLISVEAALFILAAPSTGRAQTFPMRLLEAVRIDRAGEAWDVTIDFNVPVQVRRHSPAERGETVHVQIALLGLASAPPPRESLNVPRNAPVPLESVSYEAQAGDFSMLELRFSRDVSFEVLQGRDLRSVVLRVKPDPRPRPEPNGAGPALPPADERTVELVTEGRRALTGGEFERAALLLQEVLERPESDQTPEALELLGLARERKGQLAHAKAAYQDYLRRFPDGEGAKRVRQRLDALITASAKPIPPRRQVRSEKRPSSLDLESFGSAYIGYHHSSQRLDGVGNETFDSSLFTDLYSDTRLRLPGTILRAQFSGGYRHQFAADAGGDETDVGSLFFSFEQPEGGLSGSVGRRTRSTGGVLGRYDGAQLAYRGGETWEIGVLGGMPVDSSRWTGFETDRFLGGVNLELGTFFDSLDVDLYAIGQSASGLLDRAAVGSEIRFFRKGLFAAAYFDYDAYFTSLNVAQLTASWQATSSTTFTGFFDYRNVPFLTTRNAVQGQVGGLSSLEDVFSDLGDPLAGRGPDLARHDLQPGSLTGVAPPPAARARLHRERLLRHRGIGRRRGLRGHGLGLLVPGAADRDRSHRARGHRCREPALLRRLGRRRRHLRTPGARPDHVRSAGEPALLHDLPEELHHAGPGGAEALPALRLPPLEVQLRRRRRLRMGEDAERNHGPAVGLVHDGWHPIRLLRRLQGGSRAWTGPISCRS